MKKILFILFGIMSFTFCNAQFVDYNPAPIYGGSSYSSPSYNSTPRYYRPTPPPPKYTTVWGLRVNYDSTEKVKLKISTENGQIIIVGIYNRDINAWSDCATPCCKIYKGEPLYDNFEYKDIYGTIFFNL